MPGPEFLGLMSSMNRLEAVGVCGAAPTVASSVFVSGDHADANATVVALLPELEWPDDSVVDLGGIRSARGPSTPSCCSAPSCRRLARPPTTSVSSDEPCLRA